ncbi:MacB family efflux pump subunit [Novosphingobium terrae]|uniref:MacB family efflux pump subunit n=1 Tax=Novosphingobium terrae TaxID=2726189 RepID=UPI00197E05DD|nr:MacB family efflux pump subunit [Novosphingobium terrae]
MSDTSLIALRGLRRSYGSGDSAVEVLRGVDLEIHAGEFVAIIGASGSGKSTLMNILGLLDRPSAGSYAFEGADTAHLSRDALAALRREAFGFVFQQYNLIASATARENVEAPAIYAGTPPEIRAAKAEALLARLGLATRADHRPSQLSGGQQQRVSIARALINGGRVILADEPTGALDSHSGAEVMALLTELAGQGHTVILITHDAHVAQAADRRIEIADGRIVSDTGRAPSRGKALAAAPSDHHDAPLMADVAEALKAARRSLASSPARTALTLLGIVIGVAAVIALLGIGQGARQTVVDQVALFGTARLYVEPGGSNPRGPGGVLTAQDAEAIRGLPNVRAAMPYLTGHVTVRHGNIDAQTSATAVTSEYPLILNWPMGQGRFFTPEDERGLAAVTAIGVKVRDKLFPDGSDPLGQFILVNNVPFQVVGVLSSKGALSGDADDDDTIAIPFSTGSQRIFGTPNVSWLSVLMEDAAQSDETVKIITTVLTDKHHIQDFTIFNKAAAVQAQSKTADTMTMLLGFTAAISLLVGGIGVMNIMLTTVSERTREIGIRMATGARTGDILRQFLTEAVLLAGVGGVAGLVLGHLVGLAAVLIGTRVIFTLHAALIAFGSAAAAGVVFGYSPARRAARLDPVVALQRT